MVTTAKDFAEYVSKDIVGNSITPDDFEATLWYVLYQLPERNRDIFLKVERDQIPVRTVGLEYGVSGQRIFDLDKETKERMISVWGDLLKNGLMQYVQITANASREYGEQTAKTHYYKIGYTDGYADGSNSRLQKHFATAEYNSISLSDLALSYRTQHFLFDASLLNVSQIIERGDNIMLIRNLGRASLTELIERLKEFGVDVGMHFPNTIKRYKINLEDENV